MVTYKIVLPKKYIPPPLPGWKEWIEDLIAHPELKQRGALGTPEGPNCCLGRYCLLQGRLSNEGQDRLPGDRYQDKGTLALNNPSYDILSLCGNFPSGVRVCVYYDPAHPENYQDFGSLTSCNDFYLEDGTELSFAQIAKIISNVWSDGGPSIKTKQELR